MIFCVLNPEEIWHQWLLYFPTSPVFCSHFILGNPKSHFPTVFIHTFIHASTLVLGLFSLSQKKTNCYSLTHRTWKMSLHYLVKCTTFSSDWRYVAFLQTLVAVKRAGCDVWQLECQASNVTANVQSDHLLHGYMLPVFFTTDQLHRPPRCAKIQPMSQRFCNSSVSRIGTQYTWKNEKDEKFVHFAW